MSHVSQFSDLFPLATYLLDKMDRQQPPKIANHTREMCTQVFQAARPEQISMDISTCSV